MSTFSPNLDLELVARGADIGVWDTPTNSNWGIVDSAVGGITTISLNNSGVILNAAQFQSRQLTFNSTLTGNCIITFPTSFTKSYEVQNLCTGSSAFIVVLETTAAGAQAIACPPGVTIDVFNDGANLKFKNLGFVGEYRDFAGTQAPIWVTGCTIPPFLNCDGSAFNTTTFPQLFVALGSSVLPDRRGTFGATLNQGTNRITTAGAGVDGNTRFTVGGQQTNTLGQTHLPSLTLPVAITDPGHIHATQANSIDAGTNLGNTFLTPIGGGGGVTGMGTQVTGISATVATGGSATPFTNIPPTTIIGITMIRAG